MFCINDWLTEQISGYTLVRTSFSSAVKVSEVRQHFNFSDPKWWAWQIIREKVNLSALFFTHDSICQIIIDADNLPFREAVVFCDICRYHAG